VVEKKKITACWEKEKNENAGRKKVSVNIANFT